MTFDQAFTRLLGHEGQYSNNPADPGGATCWGITQTVARANGYMGDMRDLPQDVAKQIYRKLYLDAPCIVNLPTDVQFDVFDGAVNSGASQSIRWLQRAIGVVDDGIIGHITIKACGMMPAGVVSARYNGQRLDFMCKLKTWPIFGGGWARRIAANLMEV